MIVSPVYAQFHLVLQTTIGDTGDEPIQQEIINKIEHLEGVTSIEITIGHHKDTALVVHAEDNLEKIYMVLLDISQETYL